LHHTTIVVEDPISSSWDNI